MRPSTSWNFQLSLKRWEIRGSIIYFVCILARIPQAKTWTYLNILLFFYFQVTTRVSKPVDLPPPSKKVRASAPTPRSKPARPSVPWANGAFATSAPPDDAPLVEVDEEDEESEATTAEPGAYQQVCGKLVSSCSAGRGGGFRLIGSRLVDQFEFESFCWLYAKYTKADLLVNNFLIIIIFAFIKLVKPIRHHINCNVLALVYFSTTLTVHCPRCRRI